MKQKKLKYELLAPVGNFPMLVAAVNAGADSVYFGLQEFTMRTAAKNFKINDLDKMREICNSSEKKVKMYLTLNTIIYSDETEKLENTIKKVKGKVDAIICWDIAVIKLCRKYKIPFHISTQASVSNIEAAKFYDKLGAKRIVLARELNLKQITKISKAVKTEIECFAHGAMCLAISGRCLMSQNFFKKSANRGECLQNCRRTYNVVIKDEEDNEMKIENQRVLSAKDLCTLPFIEKMKKAGIKSFKIEGRNRDVKYVDTITRIYKKALDKKINKKEIKNSLKELKKVYNREFSSGFYLGLPTSDDFSSVENSSATEKKHFVGKISHYYPKVGVATIKLVSELKTGNQIIIIGNSTGIKKSKIERIEINKKSIKKGKKGEEIGIKLPPVKKNDEVYIIIKNKKIKT